MSCDERGDFPFELMKMSLIKKVSQSAGLVALGVFGTLGWLRISEHQPPSSISGVTDLRVVTLKVISVDGRIIEANELRGNSQKQCRYDTRFFLEGEFTIKPGDLLEALVCEPQTSLRVPESAVVVANILDWKEAGDPRAFPFLDSKPSPRPDFHILLTRKSPLPMEDIPNIGKFFTE